MVRTSVLRTCCYLLALIVGLTGATAVYAQATPPFVRTAIVNSGGTPAANGLNLLNTLASITTASATDPWLIKVEPGIYDLGTQELVMKNFVDIEGSGRNATFIQKSISLAIVSNTVVVNAGIDAELRNLTVVNIASGVGTGIRNASSELKLTQVNVEVSTSGNATGIVSTASNPRLSGVFPRVNSGSGAAVGMLIDGGGPIINEMFVFILDSTTTSNTGLRITNGATPVVEGVSAVIVNGPVNTGIEVSGSAAPRITNNRLTVSGGNAAYGIRTLDGTFVEIQEVTVNTDGSGESIALLVAGGEVFVGNSLLRSVGPGKSFAVFANGGPSSSTRLNQTTVEGEARALRIDNAGTVVAVGATQLSGPVQYPGTAVPTCVFAFNGAYAPLNAVCL